MIIQAITQGSSAVITILAIFLALVVGGVLIVFSDPVVTKAWSTFFSYPGYALGQTWDSVSFAYSQMFEGAILNPSTVSAAFHGGSIAAIFYPLSSTCAQATPLILTGLSVAIAFRAGLFNIGAAGQWVGGAIVATWLGFGVSLPPVIHVIVCVIGAFVGGAVIGWFVGLLKARTGAHEVIVTIMLNYVMYDLLSYLLSHPAMLQEPRSDQRDRAVHRERRQPCARRRAATAGRHRLPDRRRGRARGRLAAVPHDDRIPVPYRRRQPERRAHAPASRSSGPGSW